MKSSSRPRGKVEKRPQFERAAGFHLNKKAKVVFKGVEAMGILMDSEFHRAQKNYFQENENFETNPQEFKLVSTI